MTAWRILTEKREQSISWALCYLGVAKFSIEDFQFHEVISEDEHIIIKTQLSKHVYADTGTKEIWIFLVLRFT